MSREAVEALRLVFEQFARGEFGAIDGLSGEFVLVTAPEMPDAGTYHGDDGRQWLRSWVASFESLKFEGAQFTDAGDSVLVELTQAGVPRGGSTPLPLATWAVFEMREDFTPQRLQLFMNRGDALLAAGLTE